MYRIAFENDSFNGTQVKLLEANSVVITRASYLSQSSMSEAQSSILLDFSIRDATHNEKKWSGFQHTLQQIFANVVSVEMMPGSQCKINVFLLMQGQNAESAIINSCWAALVKLGLPMCRSIWSASHEQSTIVVNLFGEHEIIFGRYSNGLCKEDLQKMKEYERVIRSAIQSG